MEEGKRQRQVASALQEEMNEIFRRLNLTMIDGGMVSISSIKVTPYFRQLKRGIKQGIIELRHDS